MALKIDIQYYECQLGNICPETLDNRCCKSCPKEPDCNEICKRYEDWEILRKPCQSAVGNAGGEMHGDPQQPSSSMKQVGASLAVGSTLREAGLVYREGKKTLGVPTSSVGPAPQTSLSIDYEQISDQNMLAFYRGELIHGQNTCIPRLQRKKLRKRGYFSKFNGKRDKLTSRARELLETIR